MKRKDTQLLWEAECFTIILNEWNRCIKTLRNRTYTKTHPCEESGSETFKSGFFLKKSIINPANPKTIPIATPNIIPLINTAKDSLK